MSLEPACRAVDGGHADYVAVDSRRSDARHPRSDLCVVWSRCLAGRARHVRQPADTDKPGWDLRLGVPAAAASPAARTVTLAEATKLAYDILILVRKLSGTDKTKLTAATSSTRANRS